MFQLWNVSRNRKFVYETCQNLLWISNWIRRTWKFCWRTLSSKSSCRILLLIWKIRILLLIWKSKSTMCLTNWLHIAKGRRFYEWRTGRTFSLSLGKRPANRILLQSLIWCSQSWGFMCLFCSYIQYEIEWGLASTKLIPYPKVIAIFYSDYIPIICCWSDITPRILLEKLGFDTDFEFFRSILWINGLRFADLTIFISCRYVSCWRFVYILHL